MNKSDFEIKAIVAQVSQKELLDFYAAFHQVTGESIDSPFVDKKFLKERGEQTVVACRALMAGKLGKESIDKVCAVFEEFCK